MRPTASDRLAKLVLGGLGALPAGLQRRLGGKPISIDGQVLYPEVQMALRLLNAMPSSDFSEQPLEAARRTIDSEAYVFGKRLPVDRVEDLSIPGPGGTIPARSYRHAHAEDSIGTVAYFHGGGWVLGGLDSPDAVCRFIAHPLPVTVVSVDYRLAPEHPFPAGIDDALAAYRWIREQPSLGRTVAVAGDSAGGNFAAVIAQQTKDDTPPDFQLLFFPVTDLAHKSASYATFAEGFFLTEQQMDWYSERYVPDRSQLTDPRVSPLLAEDVSGLAPAHVAVAGFDVLRDEGIAYARRLQDAGVPATLQVVTGHIHAFTNTTAASRTGTEAFREAIGFLERGLRGARGA